MSHLFKRHSGWPYIRVKMKIVLYVLKVLLCLRMEHLALLEGLAAHYPRESFVC